jgi:hypothetical protein
MNTMSLRLEDEPHATSKHTICGYAWADVVNALLKTIGSADNVRAQRWAAELVCSELGLGRLEAALTHAWALHIGGNCPSFGRTWYNTIANLRNMWSKSGGDIKSVRNTPIVRQHVAEAVATLVLCAKKPLPAMPTAADCYKEAEALRAKFRSGGGAGDQVATRRVWVAGIDGMDLKTVCNEFEAALRGNQTSRMLFWIVWLITLDGQPETPAVKERGPGHLTAKQRKSILWFMVAVLRELADESAYLSVEERNGLFGILDISWGKLAKKGQRDMIAALAIAIQEHMMRKSTLILSAPIMPPTITALRNATATIDSIYTLISTEAKKFMLERPEIAHLTEESAAAARAPPKLSYQDKLDMVYSLAQKPTQ